MISEVVAHVHLLDLPVLVLRLDEHVFEEVVIVLLQEGGRKEVQKKRDLETGTLRDLGWWVEKKEGGEKLV